MIKTYDINFIQAKPAREMFVGKHVHVILCNNTKVSPVEL